eukprot:746990-Hanusia_phi.AAC.4
MQSLRCEQRFVWSAHSDGKIRIWGAHNVAVLRELELAPAVRSPILCLAQVRKGRTKWLGLREGAGWG